MFMLSPPRVKLPALTWMMLVPADFSDVSTDAAGAVAERDHRDHRGDADDHAEHGQRRAQSIAAERAPARSARETMRRSRH